MTYRPVPVTTTEQATPTQEPKPVRRDILTRITPETSRLMREKAQAARERKKKEAEAAAIAAKTASQAPAKPEPAPINPELELVQEQIAHTRAVLNDRDFRHCEHCKRSGLEPQHRAQLLKALDALLDRKRILSGDPLPGSRRPAPETQRSRSSSFLAPADLPPATPQEGQAQEQE